MMTSRVGCLSPLKECLFRAHEMVQWVKTLAAKLDLSSIPRNCTVEGKNRALWTGACRCVHTHVH